ncbi:toxic anion resistance protein [Pseudomonas sp.]|uniref:toxic anion resistance protein n=1 Tax=Pseudomonas sp. TaxID=306 RepID=UPI00299EB1A5|nr:toxic anion resistance protein [Pseudomonas sp.]MDX1366894.1 toxic anion resistance protein [Pseudomonas sp.]
MNDITEIEGARMQSQDTRIAVTSAETLKQLGLQEADLPMIQEVATRIQEGNPLSVAEFGRDVAEHTSAYADSLLDQVRNSDLDEAGTKLTQVVAVAQSLNLGALTNRRSRIPVIGPVIDRMRMGSGKFMAQFDTTRDQIEKLVSEVSQTQQNISDRNKGLEEMFSAVREEHRLLGVHIAAGKQRLVEIKGHADSLRVQIENEPARLQELSDLDALAASLDKRVGDLMALQQSAMQSLPMIRMIQANNQMLVDKFHTIREITVPAWKRQFMLSLTLNEQRNAVQLATQIDDATNDLLKRNAELLHRNSVETAKANQRLVIDVETLKAVQNTLIATVQDVIKIQQEGISQRRAAEKEIQGMRLDLQKRLSRVEDKKELH